MEKVIVSKEVAEAIKECERNYIPIDTTLKFHAQDALTGKYTPLQTLTISELASALINGYEIEKTPEEMIRWYFDECTSTEIRIRDWGFSYDANHYAGEKVGIKNTLNILGITIEGINT